MKTRLLNQNYWSFIFKDEMYQPKMYTDKGLTEGGDSFDRLDQLRFDIGNYFESENDCQERCDILNNVHFDLGVAIVGTKPKGKGIQNITIHFMKCGIEHGPNIKMTYKKEEVTCPKCILSLANTDKKNNEINNRILNNL